MGLFSKMKEINAQNKETDIEKMKFERFTGFVGSLPQRFVDNAIPACPMCNQQKPWLLHVASKMEKMFPVAQQRHTYHLKCENCGMVMHTSFIETKDSMPREITSPSAADSTTIMTIDNIGNKSDKSEYVGKQLSVLEVNRLTNKE